MKLKRLLLLTSIPLFLLASKLKSQNYTLTPDSSYKITHPYPTNQIKGIYRGQYLILPTNEYSDTNAVKIISVKENIKKEIITPILNNIISKYPGINTIRQTLEDSLQTSINTNLETLSYFDIYFSDNKLSYEENHSLRLLLDNQKQKAIAYFIKELSRSPITNSKTSYDFCNIVFFQPDTTSPFTQEKLAELDSLTKSLQKYLSKKDSTKVEPKKQKKKLRIKRTWDNY